MRKVISIAALAMLLGTVALVHDAKADELTPSMSLLEIARIILADAEKHPFEFALKAWGAFAGIVAATWGLGKLIYKAHASKRLNARNMLDVLANEPVLHENDERPEKIYGAAERIREHMLELLKATQCKSDREDLQRIQQACIAFTNDQSAFPEGKPKPALGLNPEQWQALRKLRSRIVPASVVHGSACGERDRPDVGQIAVSRSFESSPCRLS